MPGLALRVAAVILGARLLAVALGAATSSSNAFVAHYTAARLVAEGAGAERFYDDAWFRGHVARFEPEVEDVFWANPPTMSLLVLPLAGAGYRTARAVWIAGSLVLFFTTVLWLVRELPLEGPWAPAFACVAFVSAPVVENLRHGQVYLLALALLTAAWWGYRNGRGAALGGPLGVLAATKATALPVWLVLLGQRRWRALAWGAGTAAALALASLPLLGVAAWWRWTAEATALPADPLLAVTAFQTVPGFWRHLFEPGDPRVGAPWIAAPLLAALASVVVVVALVAGSLLAARRAGRSDAVFAAFVLLALVVTPVSSEAHYATALLPAGILVAEAGRRRLTAGAAAVLVVGAGLVVVGVPYRSPRLFDGALALLAYPRLYGALALWGLAVAWSLGEGDPAGPLQEGDSAGAGRERS